MVTYIVLLIIGFIALIKGADWFVKGSSDIAKNLRIPSVIIGLTIVALGTSAPELAVSVAAAIQGANEISVSNVVGSNIFNLMVVLGICASIHPLEVDKKILKRDMPISILATIVTLGFCVEYPLLQKIKLSRLRATDEAGMIQRWLGVALIISFAIYLYLLICDARKNPIEEDDVQYLPIWKCLVLVIVGLVLIIGGGQAVVNGAREIARMAGMTETLIGLTIVAVGTSLPELVTSIVASKKGETDLAIGNAVGSNIFNLLLILGLSGTIHPMTINLATIIDIIILILCSILTFIYSRTAKRINRLEGLSMVILYVIYVGYAILR
ncbi:MAG: calcium/sodium antiporter [Pseudobutyrivibrio sp.]|uniref:calcium/sodium antiporter n=1 Tax=Pseudobutyrivibrio sp. TaxID=2014367 RepID=UPI0025F532A8|nr:calcium/sodium antiporter [Pseudobutyrivibrio sp.]MBE5903653.1 calcium/sodium antiporter [Pseudobutyrivibrio sp.]